MPGAKKSGAAWNEYTNSASGACRRRKRMFATEKPGRPEVWVSRWRTVTVVRSAESRPLAGPSRNSGSSAPTGSSRANQPRSTPCMTAVAVTGLVIEASAKTVPASTGRLVCGSAVPT